MNILNFSFERNVFVDPDDYKKVRLLNFKIKEDYFILIISLLIGTLFILISLILELYKNPVVFSIIVIVVYSIYTLPYIFYKTLEEKEKSEIEKNYPVFLRSLSESLSSGMTIIQALRNTLKQDMGALNKYVNRLYIWLSWGMDFEKAFENYNKYFEDNKDIKRVNYVILEAYKSGGDISKTIKTISEDMEALKDIDDLKKAYIGQQSLVMYVIYFVFIGLLISILQVMKPIIAEQELFSASGNHAFGLIFSGGVPISWIKFISFLSIIMEGISISLIIGYAQENNLKASLKHIGFTTFIGILAYLLFIYPSTVTINLVVTPQTPFVGQTVQILVQFFVDGQPVKNSVAYLSYSCNGNIIINNAIMVINNGQATENIETGEAGNCIVTVQVKYNGQIISKSETIQVTG